MVKIVSGVATGKRGASRVSPTAGEFEASRTAGFLKSVSFVGPEEVEPADVLGLLDWRFRYAPELRGRDRELASLHDWACGRKALDVLVLTGAGGSGRKRLAAELAMDLHRRENWLTGFLAADAGPLPRKRPRGLKQPLLIIVDRAEENAQRVEALLERLGGWSLRASTRVRVLLLAREAAVGRLAGIRRGGMDDARTMVLRALAPADAVKLANDVISVLTGRGPFGRVDGASSGQALETWLAEAPDQHGLPLSVIAASMHALLDPGNAFALPLREVLADIAGRQLETAREISLACGLGASGLPRLLGLATLKGGLDSRDVGRLSAVRGLCDGDGPLTTERLSGTPWWNGGKLQELLPEKAGAAFIARGLLEDDRAGERLPGWIATALKGAESEFAARLPRLAHDIYAVNSAAGRRFVEILAEMVRGRPELAGACSAFAQGREAGPMTAAFAAAVAEELLGSDRRDQDRPALLIGLSDALALLGRHGAALEAAEEAVASGGERSATAARVRALRTLSARLAELGRAGAALKAAEEAVKAARALSIREPATGAPLLVLTLDDLSARLAKLERHGAALEAAEEAVKAARALSMREPATGAPLLVRALDGLSARLVTLGRHGAALEAAEEAVKTARGLPDLRAVADMHLLARALNDLSGRLEELGRFGPAVEAAEEAADMFRRLVMRDRLTYLPELARALSRLSALRSALGRHKGALEAMEEAIARQRELVGRNRALHLPRLADALVAWSGLLLGLGRHGRALEAAVEAVEYRRRLADQNPMHKAGLADALVALARVQAALGRHGEAAAAITEALGVLKEPFLKWPEAYVESMARALESYLEYNDAAGLEPDMKLVEPILEKIDELRKG